MLLGLINSSISVPFIFFNRKRAPPTVKNTFKNKTEYKNIPVVRYNSSLLITMIMHDLCFVHPNSLNYVYIKDKLT